MSNLFTKVSSTNYKGTSGDDNYQMYSKQFNDLVDALNALLPDGVLNIDTIVEKTGANGVNIDGLNIKDNIITKRKESILSGTSLNNSGVSLTTSQSGSIILLDKADGLTITLPADSVGLTYKFVTTVDLTSSNYIIQGYNSSDIFKGGVLSVDDTTPEVATMFKPNGTSHYICTMNGTTTGGEIGTELTFTCVATNTWLVTGTVAANGTLATPFS